MKLVASAVILAVLAISPGLSQEPNKAEDKKPGKQDYSKDIVGKWEITKAGTGAPVGSTMEFSKDGKVVAVVKGSNVTLKGKFKIEKDMLTLDLDLAGEESMKIAKLTEDALVTKAGERETVYKKVK